MMARSYFVAFIIFILTANLQAEKQGEEQSLSELKELKRIFDSHGMKGSFLVSNQNKNEYRVYNKLRAEKSYLPASTFKIPNTIIGLETGVINSETIFKWDSTDRTLDVWEQDLPLREAYNYSCVPCYQELARKIGIERMGKYLEQMKFGKMVVEEETIDNFWLEGSSSINSFEMLDFLKRFYEDQLGIKHSTKAIMLEIMLQESSPQYKLYGKTGWAIRNGNNYGWFAGILTTPGNVYFFVLNLEPKNPKNMQNFAQSRKEIAVECLRKLGLLK